MSITSTQKPTLVKVVIPIYRNLNDEETASLNNTMEILGQHPIAFLLPESYKADYLLSKYPKAEAIRVSDKWLGIQCGIAGYNKLLQSFFIMRVYPHMSYRCLDFS